MRKKDGNRLRMLCLGIVVLSVLACFVCKTDIMTVLGQVYNSTIIAKSIPAYSYINNIENPDDTGAQSLILGSVYPGKKYYVTTGSNAIINVTEYEKEEELTNSENETQESLEVETQSDSLTENLSKTDTNSDKSMENVISKNDVSGSVYSKQQLSSYDFSKKFYTVTSVTSLTNQIFNPEVLLNKDLTIKQTSDKPQILIFHTHSQEDFVDSVAGDSGTTIVGVGSYLEKVLEEKYGYNVIHDTSVYDYVDGKLDRSKAYTYAVEGINKILQENPSIEVVIDLHRDGVGDDVRLVTNIDGKDVAKIMLLNGISYSNVNGELNYLNNPFREDNLATSLQMKLLGEAYYPGFFRNNYINAYRYGLHLRGKSMLVEAGAQTNTFDEVKNAMEPLADVIDKMLKGQKAY